jgi:sugar lactone lactonase YvrE
LALAGRERVHDGRRHRPRLQISSTGLAGPPSPGKLIRVAANGKKTELAAGMLESPTGIAVSGDGDIYVANKGSSGTDAEIVRIPVED